MTAICPVVSCPFLPYLGKMDNFSPGILLTINENMVECGEDENQVTRDWGKVESMK